MKASRNSTKSLWLLALLKHTQDDNIHFMARVLLVTANVRLSPDGATYQQNKQRVNDLQLSIFFQFSVNFKI